MLKKENEIEISIVVPVYNVKVYLGRCIKSIVQQTYTSYEVILVDDGSTDGSSELCDQYERDYAFVRTIHKENGGLSSARNAALDVAKGNYIYFFDSDDYIEADTLEVLYHALISNDADMSVCSAKMEWETGEQKEFIRLNNEVFCTGKDFKKALFQVYFRKLGACVWNKLYKRSLIEKHNLRFARNIDVHSEDIYFNTLYLLDVGKIVTVSNCQYHYMQRSGSITNCAKYVDILWRYINLVKMIESFSVNYERFDEMKTVIPLMMANLIMIPLNHSGKEIRKCKPVLKRCLEEGYLKEQLFQYLEYHSKELLKYGWTKADLFEKNTICFLISKGQIELAIQFIRLRKLLSAIKNKWKD